MSGKTNYTKNEKEIKKIMSIEGNTVRKINTMPEYVPYEKPEKEKQKYKQTGKNKKSINAGYVVAVSFFLVACLLICVGYLTMHSENSRVRNSITSLEGKLETVTAQNDSLDYTINSYVDLDYVSEVASKELGMIRITKDQITMYDSSEFEYMQMYSGVPEE